MAEAQPTALLEVNDLSTSFASGNERLTVLDKVSFKLFAGETLSIVGESGCGKSVTALSIMRLLPLPSGQIDKGEIIFQGQDLLRLDIEAMHQIRGKRIAMIFQEPMTALNPVHRIGKQLAEVYALHFTDIEQAQIDERSVKALEQVGIADPSRVLKNYPHQLSGGMRQRVMIAMALACEPDILIADEPTTALDVTIQAQILELLKQLQQEYGMSILFITHDLGVVAEISDRVLVMYGGRGVESADSSTFFKQPRHPYSQGLIASLPRLENPIKSELTTIRGNVPALKDMPQACRFSTRCEYVQQDCQMVKPVREQISKRQWVRCHHWQSLERDLHR